MSHDQRTTDLLPALCTVAARPDPTFSAWLAEHVAAREANYTRFEALHAELMAMLGPDGQAVYRQLDDVEGDDRAREQAKHLEVFFRHFPGLEPALRIVWAHVVDDAGRDTADCCAAILALNATESV
jgi:hypothetical protein